MITTAAATTADGRPTPHLGGISVTETEPYFNWLTKQRTPETEERRTVGRHGRTPVHTVATQAYGHDISLGTGTTIGG
jgi:hypothetical protein